MGDFPVGPVVESLPSSAGDVDLIPGQGTEVSHGFRQLRLHTPATQFVPSGFCVVEVEILKT